MRAGGHRPLRQDRGRFASPVGGGVYAQRKSPWGATPRGGCIGFLVLSLSLFASQKSSPLVRGGQGRFAPQVDDPHPAVNIRGCSDRRRRDVGIPPYERTRGCSLSCVNPPVSLREPAPFTQGGLWIRHHKGRNPSLSCRVYKM